MIRKRNTQYTIRNTEVYAVILVGGKGKRLRPLSTDSKPKAFISVTKDRKTMFANTVDRAAKITSSGRIMVIANKRHAHLVKKDFPGIKKADLILEIAPKNTAPAITLAASILKKRMTDPVMVILPSDQYIKGEEAYFNAVKMAIAAVSRRRNIIVVLGIKPRYPSTQYGYIEIPKSAKRRAQSVCKIKKFTEKPGAALAEKYCKSGRYLWNSGAFIFRAGAILKAVDRFAPEVGSALKDPSMASKVYGKLPDISIDYAVMEHAGNIYCVRADCGWQDLGSFDRLKLVLKLESRGYVEKGGKIVNIL